MSDPVLTDYLNGKLLDRLSVLERIELWAVLPSEKTMSGDELACYHFLHYIDRYDDTHFNGYQALGLMAELSRLLKTRGLSLEQAAAVEHLLSMARRCQEDRLYITFVGD